VNEQTSLDKISILKPYENFRDFKQPEFYQPPMWRWLSSNQFYNEPRVYKDDEKDL